MSKHVSLKFNRGRQAMLASAAAAALLAGPGAQAATTIGQFNGSNGATPYAKLLTVNCGGGNWYGFGTTATGGSSGQGVIFSEKLGGGTYPINGFYSFTGSATDGGQPLSGLIKVGPYLYGTTQAGGTSNAGTVYKISVASACTGTAIPTLLYSFRGAPDGQAPAAALLYHGGVLYGTTPIGGNGFGTVFVCKTTGGCGVIYRFNNGPADGSAPMGSLIYANNITVGSSTVTGLFGTTMTGGSTGWGTIYAVPLPQTGLDQVIWSFTHGSDGAYPMSELLLHTGDLFGTTSAGGAAGAGTVFKFMPGTTPQVPAYSFFNAATDGATPYGGLVWVNSMGKFYGTTVGGGTNSLGTVFNIKPTLLSDGVVFNFDNLATGSFPLAGLDLYSGKLYGTSYAGLGSGPGTVFMAPPLISAARVDC